MPEKRKDKRSRTLYPGENQRDDGRYMYRFTDYDGERKTVYSWRLVESDPHPKGKKKDISLREKEKQIQKDKEDFISYTASKMTLNELFDFYLNLKKRTNKIKVRTIDNYIHIWDRNVRYRRCANMEISLLRRHHFINLYQDMINDGVGNGSIVLLHKNICSILNYAANEDYIRKNYAKGCVKEMGICNNQRDALTIIEQREFLSFVAGSKYRSLYWMFVFMIETACRGSEMAGIGLDDIDLKKKFLKIDHQLLYGYAKDGDDHKRYHIASPKTKNGIRLIPLSEAAISAVINQKEMLFRLGLLNNHEVDRHKSFLFLSLNHKLLRVSYIDNYLKNIVNEYNAQEREKAEEENRSPVLLPNITAHILRHTGCTRMAENGMDQRTLQEIMGHQNLNMMKVYNHVDEQRMRKEIEKMNCREIQSIS